MDFEKRLVVVDTVVDCIAVGAGVEAGLDLQHEGERALVEVLAAAEELKAVVERYDSDYESHSRYANLQRQHCPSHLGQIRVQAPCQSLADKINR